MAIGTIQREKEQAAPPRARPGRWHVFSMPGREAVLLAVTLVIAAVIRLGLAAHGWPGINSDQAILGLMANDIWRHGAHPVFFYGQHYMGALQAYLVVPFFAVFGPTTFALGVATTVQTLLFLLLLYLLVRAVFSPGVAWCSVALLGLGPDAALLHELRPGAGTQDTLLLSALLLWLVVLRLKLTLSRRAKAALHLGIGLTLGVGLWCDLLMLPFVLAALLALGVEAIGRWHTLPATLRRGRLLSQSVPLAVGALVGIAPAIPTTIASRGILFGEVFAAAGVPESADALQTGTPGFLVALGQQILAALLLSLPRTLGNSVVCGPCVPWPAAHVSATIGQVVILTLLSAPFSLAALAFWLRAARPLARDAWAAWRARRAARRSAKAASPFTRDYRWWGRAMLVMGGGLTALQFVFSRASYTHVNADSARYLVGLYLCVPLVADPLWRGTCQAVFWLRARARMPAPSLHARLRYGLAAGLLAALFALNTASAGMAFQQSADPQAYGVPAGARDQQVIAFLKAHQATRFYASYWVCYRLAFESEEQVICAVISPTNAFASGHNRKEDYAPLVAAAPHPAYVFDLRGNDLKPSVPAQVGERLAAGDPQFAGYTSARVADYLIYYYAGGPPG